jgi:hypothetical protein
MTFATLHDTVTAHPCQKHMPSWAKLVHMKLPPVASTRRYHHIGIPTTERREGERLIKGHATFVSGLSWLSLKWRSDVLR